MSLAILSCPILLRASANINSAPGLCLITTSMQFWAANSHTSLAHAHSIGSRPVPDSSTAWDALLSVLICITYSCGFTGASAFISSLDQSAFVAGRVDCRLIQGVRQVPALFVYIPVYDPHYYHLLIDLWSPKLVVDLWHSRQAIRTLRNLSVAYHDCLQAYSSMPICSDLTVLNISLQYSLREPILLPCHILLHMSIHSSTHP